MPVEHHHRSTGMAMIVVDVVGGLGGVPRGGGYMPRGSRCCHVAAVGPSGAPFTALCFYVLGAFLPSLPGWCRDAHPLIKTWPGTKRAPTPHSHRAQATPTVNGEKTIRMSLPLPKLLRGFSSTIFHFYASFSRLGSLKSVEHLLESL